MAANPRFEQSYARIFGHGVGLDETAEPFFERFYEEFVRDGEVAARFADTDLARQAAMLRRSFFHLAAFYVTCDPAGELERLADVHDDLGIPEHLYDRWLDALVATVTAIDPQCSDPEQAELIELAWRLAMTPGITWFRMRSRR